VRLEVTTNHAPWHRYLAAHFGPLVRPTPSGAGADIIIRAAWEDQRWRERSMRAEQSERFPDRLGGSIVASADASCWVQKLKGSRRLRLTASWEGKRLRLDGTYRRKALKETLKTWQGDSGVQQLFELTYPLIYYPLWYYLEANEGRHVAHASAVARHDKATVFSGLEGIGKTTLALACVGAGATLMADNLIWYDDQRVVGVPEPIRLHDPTAPLVAKMALRPLGVGSAQKGFFRAAGPPIEPATPVAWLLPMFGARTEIVPLDPEICADRILATNPLTGELGPYVAFVSWMSLLKPIPQLETLRRQRLVELLRRCRCGLLRMKPDHGRDVISKVLAWADGR